MKPEAQRIAIAEACGFSDVKVRYWDGDERNPVLGGRLNGVAGVIPVADYVHDLNAMAEAEKTLQEKEQSAYSETLDKVVYQREDLAMFTDFKLITATAAQRAEAFLRTKGVWTE